MGLQHIYLDYSATTPVDKRVFEAMAPFFREKFGNASSVHGFGRDAKEGLENARESIALLLKAQPGEIYFTSGGTEADNLALIGYCLKNKDKGNHIVTCIAEHPAVLNACRYLEGSGFTVTYLPLEPDGTISVDKLYDAMTDTTLLVSIMHVNNEVGTINDIDAIGKHVKKKSAVFQSDCVQSFGKIPIDVNTMCIDMLSLSSHKIYGPKGVGALYIRKGIQVEKLVFGGGQERNKRAGTENVAAIVGFGTAASVCKQEMDSESANLRELRDNFWKQIKNSIPDVRLNGTHELRLPGNLNVSFKDTDGESILLSLDLHGVAASAGSACEAGSIEPSHVIEALKLPPEYAQSAIRFTLGRWTSRAEIDQAGTILKDVVERVRTLEEDFA